MHTHSHSFIPSALCNSVFNKCLQEVVRMPRLCVRAAVASSHHEQVYANHQANGKMSHQQRLNSKRISYNAIRNSQCVLVSPLSSSMSSSPSSRCCLSANECYTQFVAAAAAAIDAHGTVAQQMIKMKTEHITCNSTETQKPKRVAIESGTSATASVHQRRSNKRNENARKSYL